MKKRVSQNSKSPSQLIDARIEELACISHQGLVIGSGLERVAGEVAAVCG